MSLKKCDDCGGFNSRCEFSPRAGHYYICRDCGGDCYIHDGTYKGLMQEVIDEEVEIISGPTTEIDMTNMKIGKMVLRNPHGVEVGNLTGEECDHTIAYRIPMMGAAPYPVRVSDGIKDLSGMAKCKHCPDCGVRLGGE